VALVTALGPELQAVLMLTRFRRQGEASQQPAEAAQSLLMGNHCFVSAPLGG